MIGAMRRFALAVCLAALLVAPAAASAASAASRGVLTTAEYAQLASAQKALKSVSTAKATVLVCARTKNVSQLLKAWKRDCNGVADYALTGIRAQAAAKSCTKYSSTADRMVCMYPTYDAFYRAARAYYRADQRVDELAQARGFDSACVAVIGDPITVVAAEGRLAKNLRQLVRALYKKDAPALEAAATRADKDQDQIQSNAPTSLSLCPHR